MRRRDESGAVNQPPSFWNDTPNPTNYLALLKATYETIKKIDPGIKVSTGGYTGVPFDFIEEVYRLGGAKYFDILAVHPYSTPYDPEAFLENYFGRLRGIMTRYGDKEKPIIATEIGWSTPRLNVSAELLLPALKAARPEMQRWRAVYCDVTGYDQPDPSVAVDELRKVLPNGSRVEFVQPEDVKACLARGDVDIVFFPFDQTFPEEAFDAVVDFVKNRGGLLYDSGGVSCYTACRRTADGRVSRRSGVQDAYTRKLGYGYNAWWIDKRLPQDKMVDCVPTKEGVVAGFSQGRRPFTRFVRPLDLPKGAEFMPLIEGPASNGAPAAVALVRHPGGGGVVVSGYFNGLALPCDEARQAKLIARAYACAEYEGVAQTYLYEFYAEERNPFEVEDHWGGGHYNVTPKPSYHAYRTYAKMRPAGSRKFEMPWRNRERTLYYPQWIRPDGTRGGMIWRPRGDSRVMLRFGGDEIRFCDYLGERIEPLRKASGI